MIKKISFFVIFFTLFTIFYSQGVVFATFDDINGHWAEKDIVEFQKSEYLNVIENDSFMPDVEITKGELTYIVNHCFSYGETNLVEKNMELAELNGYLSNSKAEQKITREEIAILVCRILPLDLIDENTTFEDDADISFWAKSYVHAVNKEKIMIGYPDKKYKPRQNITRAEFVVTINRALKASDLDVGDLVDDEIGIEIGMITHNELGATVIESVDNEINLKVGESVILTVSLPEDADEEIKISVDNKSIVDFDENLYILKAKKKGMANIVFSYNDEENDVSIEVIVDKKN